MQAHAYRQEAGTPLAKPPGCTAVILQPSYLPWLGYFAQLWRSDVFVLYDDVQFEKHSWRNRNRIKTQAGPCWLSVPVLTHGQNRPCNNEILIDNSRLWRKKHFEAIRQSYCQARYFHEIIDVFAVLYAREYRRLLDVNVAFFEEINKLLGLERPVCFASELGVTGSAVERLVGICGTLGATRFYEGAAGQNYIDALDFEQAGIELIYQDYRHPIYPQLHGAFVPYLSVVDLLFNCGPKSLEILAQ
jgi:hypothetical protein